ncbi:MAG: hypothetical protein H8E16_00095 [Flavobacteriales bacterium]|jgi:hypothetical protein|nr:hypothetical protein [Flavobacteriales bacterium]MBL6877512.1 hypothetical protein [Flavobacteriaceae bacterium]
MKGNILFKLLLNLIVLFNCTKFIAQSDSEIFLLDIKFKQDKIEISNVKKISNNKGYNNQPIFVSNDKILFTSERNLQNDIVQYDSSENSLKYLTNTLTSEYSPIRYKKNKVTAVSLDEKGEQYLRIYNIKDNTFKIPFTDKIVGYYNYSKKIRNLIISSVLENNQLVLYTSNLKTKEHTYIDNNTGRSIHNIPKNKFGEEKISYISKKDSIWNINYVDLSSYNTKTITTTLNNNEDICWFKDGSILTSYKNNLYIFNSKLSKDWKLLCSLEEYGITNISRIAINPDNDKLALVNSK